MPLSQEEIAARLSPWGTHLCELAALAESHGLAAIIASRDFDAVADTVRAGFPVLLSFSYPGGGHFVIAVGYDPNLDLLELRDPGFTSKSQLGRIAFRSEAGYHDYLTAVICPPEKCRPCRPTDTRALWIGICANARATPARRRRCATRCGAAIPKKR